MVLGMEVAKLSVNIARKGLIRDLIYDIDRNALINLYRVKFVQKKRLF